MKTNSPGIFVPFFKDVFSDFQKASRHQEALQPEREKHLPLTELLHQAGIPNTNCICCQIRYVPESQKFNLIIGCLITLEHPEQMEYIKALNILGKDLTNNKSFKADEYTVPLNGVAASGLGVTTKTLYCHVTHVTESETYNRHIVRIAQMLQKLYQRSGFSFSVNLCLEDEGISLQATSPIKLDDNHDAWQKYLGEALRQTGYKPYFYGTWSTNAQITRFFQEKAHAKN